MSGRLRKSFGLWFLDCERGHRFAERRGARGTTTANEGGGCGRGGSRGSSCREGDGEERTRRILRRVVHQGFGAARRTVESGLCGLILLVTLRGLVVILAVAELVLESVQAHWVRQEAGGRVEGRGRVVGRMRRVHELFWRRIVDVNVERVRNGCLFLGWVWVNNGH